MKYIRVCRCLICGALIEKDIVDEKIILRINKSAYFNNIDFTSEEPHETKDHIGLTVYAGLRIVDDKMHDVDQSNKDQLSTDKLYKIHLKGSPEDELIDGVRFIEGGSSRGMAFSHGDPAFIYEDRSTGIPIRIYKLIYVDRFVEM